MIPYTVRQLMVKSSEKEKSLLSSLQNMNNTVCWIAGECFTYEDVGYVLNLTFEELYRLFGLRTIVGTRWRVNREKITKATSIGGAMAEVLEVIIAAFCRDFAVWSQIPGEIEVGLISKSEAKEYGLNRYYAVRAINKTEVIIAFGAEECDVPPKAANSRPKGEVITNVRFIKDSTVADFFGVSVSHEIAQNVLTHVFTAALSESMRTLADVTAEKAIATAEGIIASCVLYKGEMSKLETTKS